MRITMRILRFHLHHFLLQLQAPYNCQPHCHFLQTQEVAISSTFNP